MSLDRFGRLAKIGLQKCFSLAADIHRELVGYAKFGAQAAFAMRPPGRTFLGPWDNKVFCFPMWLPLARIQPRLQASNASPYFVFEL
jgi:hypothetical protein